MTLRVACLGAGYFSRFHFGSWRRINGVELSAVCDLDHDKALASGAPGYTDLSKMLEAVKPDILDVITPPAGHANAIETALDHGIKWIICQKPFGTSLSEARALTQKATAAGATLVIHENFRFTPWHRFIKTVIDNGDLGDVLQATFRLRPGDGQGPDAYLDRQPYFQKMPQLLIHETGVHWVDTFRFLFGNPTAVYADLRKVNPVIAGEDAGFVLFDHPGGVRSLLDGNRCLDHAAENTRCTMGEALIEGTKACLDLKGDGSVWLRPFSKTHAKQVLAPDSTGIFGGDCAHHLQSHVISAIQSGETPENTAPDYLIVREIEDAIYASAETGQKVQLAAS